MTRRRANRSGASTVPSTSSNPPAAPEIGTDRSDDAATAHHDVLHPELLADRYELGPVIGRGATGTVRHGQDRLLGRDVAIKSLYPHLLAEGGRERFLREAQLAARLQHPHAVAVHDVGTDDEPFIVMEHLAGGTLADRVREHPLSPAAAIELGRQILAALEAAHACGIVHRDIKPANIMFTHDGAAKLVDFGIATSADHANHTATGIVLGTLAYLAPERLCGGRASIASDLYSVGVVLHEAITGSPPFHAEIPAALLNEITTAEEPPDLAATHPDIDPAVAATISRALHRDPSQRFASAADMSTALVTPAPASVADRAPRPARPDRTERLTSPVRARAAAARPHVASIGARVTWLWLAGALAIVLAIGIFVTTRGDASPTPRTSVDAEVGVDQALDQAIDALDAAVRAR